MHTTECLKDSRISTSSKSCQNCAHMTYYHSCGTTVCNLYHKYTIAAKVLCAHPITNELTDWVQKPKR